MCVCIKLCPESKKVGTELNFKFMTSFQVHAKLTINYVKQIKIKKLIYLLTSTFGEVNFK
jgi:hypothetical protein